MFSFRSILRAFTGQGRGRTPISAGSAEARRRFRRSMPGEMGLTAAARIYGVGR